MTKLILRWIINAIAIFLAIKFVPGIHLNSSFSIIWLALIFGLVNAFLRPLLKLLTCPLIVLTLGLFTLLINAFLFWLTGQIGQALWDHPHLRWFLADLLRRVGYYVW